MGITKKYATYETYETKMLHVSQRRALEFETLILSYVNEQKNSIIRIMLTCALNIEEVGPPTTEHSKFSKLKPGLHEVPELQRRNKSWGN